MAKNTKGKKQGRGTNERLGRSHGTPGNGALKKGSAFVKSNASTKIGRRAAPGHVEKKGSRMRTVSTIKRLNMYKQKAPKKAELIKQDLQPKRIAPDRRWFGNTRVITQQKMQDFRAELSKTVNDPFSVVLKNSKLPLSLLEDSTKKKRMDLLQVESYDHTFGPKKQRKRPKLASYDMEAFVAKAEEKEKSYEQGKDDNLEYNPQTGERKVKELSHCKEEIFDKGTSRRIWGELYKVIDSSDVLIQVLDARDPLGTRCYQLERELKKNHPHKHLIFLLNKVDLIPTWATKRWVEVLRKEYPTVAFHASITNPFGKSALIQLLRQFLTLLKNRKHVSCGFFGYPNVGKSSAINALKKKKVCKAAPVPGETKVWQYIKVTSKLYCIDCPGVVPPAPSDFTADCAKVLKGVVRAEKIEDPSNYIDEVLSRVKQSYIIEKYKMAKDTVWTDGEDFLTILAKKMGKLKRGGEPDIETAARIVLYDWQRGRLAYFTPPPEREVKEEEEEKEEVIGVNQKFEDLTCEHKYDEEDLHGDQLHMEEIAPVEAPAKIAQIISTEEGFLHGSGDAKENVEESNKKNVEAPVVSNKKKKNKKNVGAKEKKSTPKEDTTQEAGEIDWDKVVADNE